MVTPVTADTNRVGLYISEEPDDSWGQAYPVGVLAYKAYEARYTGETLAHQKGTVTSETIRQDRQRDTISEVSANANGDINFELSFFDHDLILENALADDRVFILDKSFAAGDIDSASGTNTFDATAGDFDEFVVGAEVWVGRYDSTGTLNFPVNAKNNGRFMVTGITAGAGGKLEVAISNAFNNTLVTEAPVTAVNFKSNKIKIATDIATTAPDKIISTTTDFTADMNLEVGQWIRTAGFTDAVNNGLFKITAIAAAQITLDTAVIETHAAETLVDFTGVLLKNGTKRKSLAIEKSFTDIAKFGTFSGMRGGELSQEIVSEQLVTASLTFSGKEVTTGSATLLGTSIPSGSTDSLNATTNVGTIEEGGVALTTAIKGISITTGNNLRNKPQVGSKSPVDIGYGFIDVSGSLNAYFQDLALWDKFVNHTQTSLTWRFTDSAGNVMVYTIPRLYFSDGNPTSPGGNDDVMVPLEFTAIRDLTRGATVIIDIIAA